MTFPRIVLFAMLTACGSNGSTPSPDGPTVNDTRSETCAVTAGDERMLLRGHVLAPTGPLLGEVLVEGDRITCVAADCAAAGATIIDCGNAAIAPGLINTHDHITFTQNAPYTATGERYEHRHDWRRGLRGHTVIPASGGASQEEVSWGELRFLLGGATSIVGSGGAPGFLRNLDQANNQEGLGKPPVEFETFPLGDSNGTLRSGDCNYGNAVSEAEIAQLASFEPHVAEGIDDEAHNEFLCLSDPSFDTVAPGLASDLTVAQTAMIHGIGLRATDYAMMGQDGTALIWSPRSNITLYGDTARVTIAKQTGVQIALGTDWMPTGSMNLLRELRCAKDFNEQYLGATFSDAELLDMVTLNAAGVVAMDDTLGALVVGRVADIAIFAGARSDGASAVINAEPKDVLLVLRGGAVMSGNAATVEALTANCDTLDVCGVEKRICVQRELGQSLAELTSAAAGSYPLFACGEPANEPSCVPTRMAAVDGSSVYMGVATASDSDGDGVPNQVDLCPSVFDPIRPMDAGQQPDADGDGDGDACDVCPLNVGTVCDIPDPSDGDGDGIANAADNCPGAANADQADGDNDGKGDVCDACPAVANPGNAPCPSSIYAVKSGVAAIGSAVQIAGLVTGKGANGFTMQLKEGDVDYAGADHSGIFVFTGNGPLLANATIGARVAVAGTVTDYFGQIELASVTAVTVVAAGPEAPPAPQVVPVSDIATGGPRAQTLEGVLVSVNAVNVTAQNAEFNEFTVSDGATITVDDFLSPITTLPAVNTAYASVTGILLYRFNESKLTPRSGADLVLP